MVSYVNLTPDMYQQNLKRVEIRDQNGELKNADKRTPHKARMQKPKYVRADITAMPELKAYFLYLWGLGLSISSISRITGEKQDWLNDQLDVLGLTRRRQTMTYKKFMDEKRYLNRA